MMAFTMPRASVKGGCFLHSTQPLGDHGTARLRLWDGLKSGAYLMTPQGDGGRDVSGVSPQGDVREGGARSTGLFSCLSAADRQSSLACTRVVLTTGRMLRVIVVSPSHVVDLIDILWLGSGLRSVRCDRLLEGPSQVVVVVQCGAASPEHDLLTGGTAVGLVPNETGSP